MAGPPDDVLQGVSGSVPQFVSDRYDTFVSVTWDEMIDETIVEDAVGNRWIFRITFDDDTSDRELRDVASMLKRTVDSGSSVRIHWPTNRVLITYRGVGGGSGPASS